MSIERQKEQMEQMGTDKSVYPTRARARIALNAFIRSICSNPFCAAGGDQ